MDELVEVVDNTEVFLCVGAQAHFPKINRWRTLGTENQKPHQLTRKTDSTLGSS